MQIRLAQAESATSSNRQNYVSIDSGRRSAQKSREYLDIVFVAPGSGTRLPGIFGSRSGSNIFVGIFGTEKESVVPVCTVFAGVVVPEHGFVHLLESRVVFQGLPELNALRQLIHGELLFELICNLLPITSAFILPPEHVLERYPEIRVVL